MLGDPRLSIDITPLKRFKTGQTALLWPQFCSPGPKQEITLILSPGFGSQFIMVRKISSPALWIVSYLMNSICELEDLIHELSDNK